MKEKIFNTNFEVAMRILMLLNAFKEGLDEERILFFDFFTMYAKNYGFGNENINGESSYMINELTRFHISAYQSLYRSHNLAIFQY